MLLSLCSIKKNSDSNYMKKFNIKNLPNYSLHNVLEARARLGEGPIWDSTRNLLYWVDIYNHRVHQFNPSTGKDIFFDVGDLVGWVALAGENLLIMEVSKIVI